MVVHILKSTNCYLTSQLPKMILFNMLLDVKRSITLEMTAPPVINYVYFLSLSKRVYQPLKNWQAYCPRIDKLRDYSGESDNCCLDW